MTNQDARRTRGARPPGDPARTRDLLAAGVRTIAVTSGKGGVGKTSIVVNLAVALARLGGRVALLDADYGLGNIDIFLGLEPSRTLEHVLRGSATLADILIDGPEGVRILPAATGVQDLTSLSHEQEARLRQALRGLSDVADLLLVDTASGISDNVVSWLSAAGEVLVVTSPDPAAIVDAYAVTKLLARLDRAKPIALLVNQAVDEAEAQAVHERLATAVRQFLRTELGYLGCVLHDPAFAAATRRREAIVASHPESSASRCLAAIAHGLYFASSLNEATAEWTGTSCLEPAGR